MPPSALQTAGLERVRALSPLLAAIAREIEERSSALEAILVSLGRTGPGAARAALEAERAAHRRELRQARAELGRLGCAVVSTRPCVFCVTVGEEGEFGLVYWEGSGVTEASAAGA